MKLVDRVLQEIVNLKQCHSLSDEKIADVITFTRKCYPGLFSQLSSYDEDTNFIILPIKLQSGFDSNYFSELKEKLKFNFEYVNDIMVDKQSNSLNIHTSKELQE